MRKIGSRLMEIARRIKKDERIADIGSDHGYLPIYLLKNDVISAAVVTDISEEPLEKARLNAEAYRVRERITLILCDGLDGLRPDMADTIIIAGMGGDTIAGILDRAPWSKEKRLLLQPMSAADRLRAFLSETGYTIADESIIKDSGKHYFTIEARGGHMRRLDAAELFTGAILNVNENPVFLEYINKLIISARRAICGIEKSSKAHDAARLDEYRELLRLLEAKGERL